MTDQEIINVLETAGYYSGWVVSGGELRIWEHKENPPTPLVRPLQVATQIPEAPASDDAGAPSTDAG